MSLSEDSRITRPRSRRRWRIVGILCVEVVVVLALLEIGLRIGHTWTLILSDRSAYKEWVLGQLHIAPPMLAILTFQIPTITKIIIEIILGILLFGLTKPRPRGRVSPRLASEPIVTTRAANGQYVAI